MEKLIFPLSKKEHKRTLLVKISLLSEENSYCLQKYVVYNFLIFFIENLFQDDLVVPYVLGEKLYQAALAKRPLDAKPVNFVSFEPDLGLAHIFIYSAPETPSIIQ